MYLALSSKNFLLCILSVEWQVGHSIDQMHHGVRDMGSKQKQMSRLALPLKFGQHSEKDELWQEAALK